MPNKSRKQFRIHQNVWGNWNGYLGSRKIAEIGVSAFDAREWLKEKQGNPQSVSICDFK